jgi:hypothetical protein
MIWAMRLEILSNFGRYLGTRITVSFFLFCYSKGVFVNIIICSNVTSILFHLTPAAEC